MKIFGLMIEFLSVLQLVLFGPKSESDSLEGHLRGLIIVPTVQGHLKAQIKLVGWCENWAGVQGGYYNTQQFFG